MKCRDVRWGDVPKATWLEANFTGGKGFIGTPSAVRRFLRAPFTTVSASCSKNVRAALALRDSCLSCCAGALSDDGTGESELCIRHPRATQQRAAPAVSGG